MIKKTNCKNCGYFDGTFCRVGLGWEKVIDSPIRYCRSITRLGDNPRCGKCKHFQFTDHDYRVSGFCDLHKDFRNFHDFCGSVPGYEEVPGKDLRPKPEKPPISIIINE